MARLQITLPVLNEEAQLGRSVTQLLAFLDSELPLERQIVVADNGSTDSTLALARDLAKALPCVSVISLPQRGRGRALKHTWSGSDADILCYMDIDLSTGLGALPPMLQALSSGTYDLAIGTRLHQRSVTHRCWKREVISRVYNRLLHAVLGVHFSDAQCGFKAITRDAARHLLPLVQDNDWFFDTELLVAAERGGFRIFEQPVHWLEDPDSRVRLLPTICGDLKGVVRLWRNTRVLTRASAQQNANHVWTR